MQNLNVNITPDNYPQSLYYSQNDVGREFKINITDFTIPTGATVKIQATKPSGFGFSVAGTVSGNSVTFETTAEMTDEAGRFPAELVVTSGADVIGTANFLMVGEMNPHPEGTIDGQQETIIPELTLLVERVEAAASSVLDMQVVAQTLPAGSQASYSYDEDLNKATFGIPEGQAGAGAAGVVASAYSAAKTYKVGDYVLYNSNLYRCTTAITTAEAWTAAHWTQIVLADDVTDLKTDLEKNLGSSILLAKRNPNLNPALIKNIVGDIGKNTIIDFESTNSNIGFAIFSDIGGESVAIRAWSKEKYIADNDYDNIFISARTADSSVLTDADIKGTKFYILNTKGEFPKHVNYNLEKLYAYVNGTSVKIQLAQGGITSGEPNTASNRLRTSEFLDKTIDKVSVDTPYEVTAWLWDKNGVYVDSYCPIVGQWWYSSLDLSEINSTYNVIIGIRKNDNSDISVNSLPMITLNASRLVNSADVNELKPEFTSGIIVQSNVYQENNAFRTTLQYLSNVDRIIVDKGYKFSVAVYKADKTLIDNKLYLNSSADGTQQIGFYFTESVSIAEARKNLDEDCLIRINLTTVESNSTTIDENADEHIHVFVNDSVIANYAYDVRKKQDSICNLLDFATDRYGTLGESIIASNEHFVNMPFVGGVLVNVATKKYSVANIKHIIDSMNLKGLTHLELMLTGSRLAFKLNNLSFNANGITYNLSANADYNDGGYWDEADMIELLNYAKLKNVELVPQIEMPAHMKALLCNHSDFWYNGLNDSTDTGVQHTLNINNPIAVNYAIGVLDLYAKWFASHGVKYFSFGGDEFYTRSTSLGYVSLYNSNLFEYAHFINEAILTIAKYRMIPWGWNDAIAIDGNAYPFINRNMTVNIWHIGNNWGTPQQIHENGYKIINSSEKIYYGYHWDNNIDVSDIQSFNIYQFADDSIYQDTNGVKFCIWSGLQDDLDNGDDGDMGDAKILEICELVEAFGDVYNAQKPA